MYTVHPTKPWEVVCIDFVGPLPRSVKGHKHFVIAQDKLTKWVEIKTLVNPTSISVRNLLRTQVFAKFGWPRVIISDNGSQFTSHNFKSFLKQNHIHHQFTPKYTPQCNAVERTNRVIKTMIASFLKDKSHQRWDDWIPELQFAYNTSKHEATGFTPAQLNFGRELMTPGTLLAEAGMKLPENESDKPAKIEEMLEIAKQNLKKASNTHQAKYYNLRRREWSPQIGDRVYVKEHPKSSAAESYAAKLAAKYSGPYLISDFICPNIVIVVTPDSSEPVAKVHIQDLKPVPETQ